MRKYLFFALAAMGFAACAEKGIDKNPEKGEVEESFVAITLAADDMTTRAADGVYENGTAVERAVNSANVFFFKDGNAFPIVIDDESGANGRRPNYLSVEVSETTSGTVNISDIKDAMLVIENYKGQYPNQILAVLNWIPERPSYTLEELKAEISSLGNDTDGYVMTNAVYADAGAHLIDAVELTIDHIGKSADEALANPVTIHVERIAAKVVLTAEQSGKFNVGKEVSGTPVYAQITGFELYNDYQESYLVKRIDPSWSGIGFNWNEPEWFRSYWSESITDPFVSNEFRYDAVRPGINEWVYCGENTNRTEEDRTKVIITAQLQDAGGNALEIANWYGNDYIGEDALLTVVSNTLKNTYYYSDGANYIGIEPEDLKCTTRPVSTPNAYEVYFQLSEEAGVGADRTWYEKNSAGIYTAISDAALNVKLEEVQPALVYKNGQTYYYTDIKHLGAPGSTAEYGVVRNHVYNVKITGIAGYGTPVYDPDMDFIVPEKPLDEVVTYVAAQINILSWRMVEHDYPLD